MESVQKSSESKSRKIGLGSVKSEKKTEKKGSGESDGKKGKLARSKSKEALDSTKVIRLLGNRSVYHVSAEDFVRVSQLIKQQQTAGNLMSSADLHRFSDQSIMAFVNFVQSREIKSALTYYAITELVTLAHTFQMRDLKLCLEDNIISAAKASEADLLQTLIICDVAHLNPETEKALQTLAIDQIDKLVSLPDFHKMPFHQLFQVLSSCELPVTHEMFVADVVLLWLTRGQDHVNLLAPSLLSCIRTKFLSPVDRTLIIERINQLNLPSNIIRLARNMLESTNNQRICLDPIHLKKNFPRCGSNVNPAHFNPHSSLPLSRPSFNMKIKKTKEANGKNRPTFDPTTAPKVIDLIAKDPKIAKSDKSIRSVKSNKKKNGVVPKKGSKKVSETSKTTKKSRCACVDYVRRKMSKKGKKKTGPAFKDPNAVKVRPPGVNSNKSTTKDSTTKTSMSSKFSTSTKSNVNSSRSEKRVEKRRAGKRYKIHHAIKTSKSDTENSVKPSRIPKSSKIGMSLN